MAELPEHIRKRFGAVVPDYIKDWWAVRVMLEKRREQEAAEAKAAEEAEFERKRALRRPPARVWMTYEGSMRLATVHWDPPETADELAPTGYRVHCNGSVIGNHQPHSRRHTIVSRVGGEVASVEAEYAQLSKLGEVFVRAASAADAPNVHNTLTKPVGGPLTGKSPGSDPENTGSTPVPPAREDPTEEIPVVVEVPADGKLHNTGVTVPEEGTLPVEIKPVHKLTKREKRRVRRRARRRMRRALKGKE